MNGKTKVIFELCQEIDTLRDSIDELRNEVDEWREEAEHCPSKDYFITAMRKLLMDLRCNAKAYEEEGQEDYAAATRLIIEEMSGAVKRLENREAYE